MANEKENLFFQRLTRLFRSGPAIQRKIKGLDYKNYYDKNLIQNNLGYRSLSPFGKESSPFSVLGAYGIMDRMARYSEFSEMEQCLHADTLIAVPGGFKTIKELSDEYGIEKEFVVYSYDHNKKSIVAATAKQARKTREEHMFKVVFDNGKHIIGTEDHKLLKRSGIYCRIKDLNPGDAMMPFYKKHYVRDQDKKDHYYEMIYTMDSRFKTGWQPEHRILAEFALERNLNWDEVVHHINFISNDNSLENLTVMKKNDHDDYHSKILNTKKWSNDNIEWILKFKKEHSKFMIENNPAERKDITFGRILQWCEENEFNLDKLSIAFNTDSNVIYNRLKSKGYNNFTVFASSYVQNWKNNGQNNNGNKNPRFIKSLTFENICNVYTPNMTNKQLADVFNVSNVAIKNRLASNGFSSWNSFVNNYENMKVVSVEYYGYGPVYDLTVDKYKNFATDTVVSHNTPEIATALNIYADETCATDEKGRCFHIFSEDANVRKALEELFYDTLNVEFNLRSWTRNLVKYGDLFLYNEVVPEVGIINANPIPVDQIEREEGWSQADPYAIRFKWLTRGNKILENWQMTHFRIMGNDLFLPYGTSLLDPARRIWRQLCHKKGTLVWVKNIGYKKIEDVVKGDIVYSYNADTRSLVETKVKHSVPMGEQRIVKVKTTHRTIFVTPNHGLMVKDKLGNQYYKKAEDLICTLGKGGFRSTTCDSLILPIIKNGNTSIKHALDPQKYSIKLNEKCDYESSGIISSLKLLKLNTSIKNTHSFLQGNKKILYSDYLKLKNIIDFSNVEKEVFVKKSLKKSCLFKNDVMEITLDKSFFRLFGFMLGDGWVNKCSTGIALSVYPEQNDYYINLFNETLGMTGVETNKKGTLSSKVVFSSKETAELFRDLGFKTGFANKRIPSWVYNLDQESKIELIKGLYDADGHRNGGKIQLANEDLIKDLHVLCQQSGLHVGKIRKIEGSIAYDKSFDKIVDRKDSYAIYINWEKLNKETIFEKVISVTEDERDETFDLEVDHELHNFVANGIVTHNTMIEDAMLTYRVVRSPERRVFYIDIGNIAPNDVPTYMEAAKAALRSNSQIDKINGRQDYRYNPVAIDEDYFIPVRGEAKGTKIETLAGGQHVSATEDVEYIQKKLFSALQVPRAYLGYDEAIGSKATLAQEDIRFSRTINILQKIIIAELNKMAMIHLYSKGFDGEDLVNFELFLSNPSSIALQQKLALWADRFDIVTKAKESGIVTEEWLQQEILGMTKEEINSSKIKRKEEKLYLAELESIAVQEQQPRESTTDPFDGTNYDVPGKQIPKEKTNYNDLNDEELLKSISKFDLDGNVIRLELPPNKTPINATPQATRMKRNSKRRVGMGGIENLAMPDFARMVNYNKSKSLNDATDSEFLKNPFKESNDYSKLRVIPEFSKEMKKIFKRLDEMFPDLDKTKNKLLTEEIDKKLENEFNNEFFELKK